jgi:hypothetical protein
MLAFYGHAGLMCAAFLLIAAGAAVARFSKSSRGWLGRHRLLGLCGAVCAWSGFASAVTMIAMAGGGHFGSPHTFLGALTLLTILVTPALCFAQFRFRERAAAIRILHRWFGRTTLVMMVITLLTGLSLAGIL